MSLTKRLRNSPKLWPVLVALAALSANATGKNTAASSFAPAEITGMYSFLQDGEFVQITVQPDVPAPQPKAIKVDGFVSRFGNDDSDTGLVLTQFFTAGELKGKSLHFVTRRLHGIWYEFSGEVERGPAKTRSEEGYFIIKGMLTENRALPQDKTAVWSRELEMKLIPQMDDEPPQRQSPGQSPPQRQP